MVRYFLFTFIQNSNTAYEIYFAFYLFRQVINHKLHIKDHRYYSAFAFASSSLIS
jgi:hypothetical protein